MYLYISNRLVFFKTIFLNLVWIGSFTSKGNIYKGMNNYSFPNYLKFSTIDDFLWNLVRLAFIKNNFLLIKLSSRERTGKFTINVPNTNFHITFYHLSFCYLDNFRTQHTMKSLFIVYIM